MFTLVMACVFAAAWVRSTRFCDVIGYYRDSVYEAPDFGEWRVLYSGGDVYIVSDAGSITVHASAPLFHLPSLWELPKTKIRLESDESKGESNEDLWEKWPHYRHWNGFCLARFADASDIPFSWSVTFPYWSIVFPLTVLSAHLLVRKQRPPTKADGARISGTN
ncbi:hypothetical protein [Schlesneria paludicola]|uniref:hypothetical protein n=1 Tax=Schlesneria paludicola TaxID=360056 RepID=UPI0012F8A2DA|nr:hypothetical protein [Schlesneria paludicola]